MYISLVTNNAIILVSMQLPTYQNFMYDSQILQRKTHH